MKTYKYPNKKSWKELCTIAELNKKDLNSTVRSILDNVKDNGDQALIDYTLKFDQLKLDNLQVSEEAIKQAADTIAPALKKAIRAAYENIYCFHKAQQIKEQTIQTSPGVKCWRKAVAIERVGLYIPGGEAPLFSTILMLGIPALIAGCKEIVLCSPVKNKNGLDPAILYTAKLLGIDKIFKVGGAQAIAAMAYGTDSIPKVYKIFGPGNQFVTKAKELVQQEGIAIDMPAGPSELLVVADQTAVPAFVAADLLSQAEHGTDSQVILLSNDENTITECLNEVQIQFKDLPRKKVAAKALINSKAILLNNLEECMDFSNEYAPEHLIIASEKANAISEKIVNAGSVFLGNYSCESAGDYASGTNHTLPTNGYAKNYSGVSLDSFTKKITFQQIDKEGLLNIGNTIEIMAEAEQLMAHKNAVSIRLKAINNE